MNQRLLFTLSSGSFCGLLFGYDIGAMAGAAPDVRACFGLSPAAFGIAVSAALFGTIAGSIAAGFLSDALGRRLTLSISGFLYMAAMVAAVLSNQFDQFAVSRFFCGVAIGLISVVAPMYLAEIAPSRLRGRIVGSFQLSVSIGVVAAFFAGYLLSRFSGRSTWHLLFLAGIVPAVFSELCLLRSAESPRWLGLRGRFRDVQSSLVSLGHEHLEPDAIAIADAAASSSKVALFSRQSIYPVALAVSIAMFNQLTGVNALLYYILDIFGELGSGHLNGRADAVTLSVLSLIVTFIGVGVIDKIGRKPLLLSGAIGMSICLFLLPAIHRNGWPAAAVVIVLACYEACFGFSQGSVIWVYLSEIFPLPLRARGQSLGSTVHWITNAFVVGVFPAITSYFGEKVFIGLALLMVVQFFVILLFYPETKGRRLESMALGANP
jgi:sugar porter (SP) family MFS transporter